MTKSNLEVEKKFVELVESNKYSIHSASQELGISRSVTEIWWKRYKTHLSVNEASAIFGILSDALLSNGSNLFNT